MKFKADDRRSRLAPLLDARNVSQNCTKIYELVVFYQNCRRLAVKTSSHAAEQEVQHIWQSEPHWTYMLFDKLEFDGITTALSHWQS